ncbi:MAG: hypothetical protein EX266_17105, partial [Rhodobacteraceae bacterium]
MSNEPSDTARLVLTALWAAWLMAFLYAFVAYARAPYEGAGFPDGLNKPAVFLGWQGIAALFALAVFGTSRAWPKGSAVRRAGATPLVIGILLGLAILGVLAWH